MQVAGVEGGREGGRVRREEGEGDKVREGGRDLDKLLLCAGVELQLS